MRRAAVTGLGYALVEAQDLDAWKEFACDLLGLQAVTHTADRLLLRMDEKAYRLDIRRGGGDKVVVLGWEVKGPAELAALTEILEANGYPVQRANEELIAERMVSDLVVFEDPEGQRRELFYGQRKDKQRFVSPTGARFVTGAQGMGHAFQMVRDNEAYNELYLEVLGFELSDYIHFGSLYGTFVHANARHHSFAWAPVPSVPQRIEHLMFEVDDLDTVGRAWDRVQEGAAPIAATFGKHTNDEMLSFYVHTPSGFQIEYGCGAITVDDTWTVDSYDAPSYWGHKSTDPDAVQI